MQLSPGIRAVFVLGIALSTAHCGQPVIQAFDAAAASDVTIDGVSDAPTSDVESTDAVGQDAAIPDAAATDMTAADAAPQTDAATATTDAGGVVCSADKDCPTAKPLCNIAQGTCVVCRYTAHCPGANARCLKGSCLAPKSCVSDKDCSAQDGICDAATKHCADCINHTDCKTGQVCKLNQCLPAPLDCKSSKDCSPLNQICTTADLCADCEKHSDCKAGNACNAGLCLPAVCSPGEAKCTGPISREVCADTGSGWVASTCPSQNGCTGGVCSKQICNPGLKKCEGNVPGICAPNGLTWEPKPCKTGEICLAGACTTKVCSVGDTQCTTDGKLQSCAADEKSWTTTPCAAGQACDVGKCKVQICAPSQAFCDEEKAMLCGALGLSAKIDTDCGAAKGLCAEGTCAPASCTAGDKLCKGSQIAVCATDGKSWKAEDCGDVDGNKCTKETCETKTHTCKSGPVNACDDDNPCTAGTCNGFTGACTQAPKSGLCDDGDGCTTGDTCVDGKCTQGLDTLVTWSGKSGSGFADGPVATARYQEPSAIALADDGALVFADVGNRRIRRISAAGVVATVAGTGNYGYADGLVSEAMFRSPTGVATGKSGWIYVADAADHRIRIIDSAGQVSTLVGTGVAADTDGSSDVAQLYAPDSLAVDAKGAVWVGESTRHRIRLVTAAGVTTSPIGSGAQGFADGKGTEAKLSYPFGVAIGPKGLLWFVDGSNHRVRAYDPASQVVTTKIGAGTAGFGDGAALKATMHTPRALTFDRVGRLLFFDSGNRLLRRLDADGSVVTVMGKKGASSATDGVLGTATLADIRGMVVDRQGTIVLTDRQYRLIRRIESTSKGCDDASVCTKDSCDPKTGSCVFAAEKVGVSCDDGSACTTADACDAKGACVGKSKSCDDGNSCTIDSCNPYTAVCLNGTATLPCEDGDACTPADLCIDGTCKADVGRVLTTAGSGASTSLPGKGAGAALNRPWGLARAKDGALYTSERYGHLLSRVALDGTVSAFAGTGAAGFADGPADKAQFNQPSGLATDPFGAVYVADAANHRIRMVSAKGIVTTLAGTGVAGDADGKSGAATFKEPQGLDIDAKGVIWVADTGNHRVRRIDTSGVVTTVAGEGIAGFSDGAGKYVRFNYPVDVLAMADGAVLVADRSNHRIRSIASNGVVTTWAGLGGNGATEGPRLSAQLSSPSGLALGPIGDVWITNSGTYDVRVVEADGWLRRVTQGGGGFADGPATVAKFNGPTGIVATSSSTAFVADSNNGRVRQVLRAQTLCKSGTACAPELCDSKTGTCGVKAIADGGSCIPGLCKIGSCKAGVCESPKENLCDDSKACTNDSCDAKSGQCVHAHDAAIAGCCNKDVMAEGFEKGAGGWNFDPATNGVSWAPWKPADAALTAEGTQVLKMGLPGDTKLAKLPGSYTYGYANSAPFTVPSGVASTLDFQFRFDVSPTAAHLLYGYIVLENGAAISMGTKPGTLQGWQKWSYDLSGLGGQTVQLRLRGRIYGPSAVGSGILLDDIAATSPCKAKACTTASECPTTLPCNAGACTDKQCQYTDACCTSAKACDDGKPCTLDLCNATSGCQHSALSGCCATAKDDPIKACNDNNACTADVCPADGGPCAHNAIAGCCLADLDCDDGKSCTIDACDTTKHTCSHKDVCCTTDAQCDDGDAKCTTDKCVDGLCAYTYATTAGCCQATIGPYHFNDAKQSTGWTLQVCTPGGAYVPDKCTTQPVPVTGKGWQVWVTSPLSVSPKGALYYGDPVAQNFAFGASAQAILSPAMTVQPGTSTLKFQVYWSTESGSSYDRLAAFLWVDGKRIATPTTSPAGAAAWYKGQTGYTTPNVWAQVGINVSAYVGKKLQVEFFFNSVDSTNNTGKGVFIDDVQLVSTCK